MSTVVGGLRARLIHDSFWHMIDDSIRALGWYHANTQHGPVTLAREPVDFEKEVPLNTLSIVSDTSRSEGAEMGSQLEDDTTTFYVDFFAEDDALGRHMNGDIRDILRGKFHSIGRRAPVLDVYDWREPEPRPQLFFCDLQNVVPDRAHSWPHLWQRHWFTCRVDVVDTYDVDTSDPTWTDLAGRTWEDLPAHTTWEDLA